MTTTMPSVRVWERQFAIHRQIWASSLLGSLFQPMLYLLGMGIGVGALIDEDASSVAALGGVTYFEFLAPALLATSAMTVCAQDSMWPMMDGFMWSNAYRAMTATPLTPAQVSAGIALWHATRALMTTAGVAAILLLFDDTRSWGLIPSLVWGVLTGLAFALPLTAWAATRDADQSFPAIMRFGIVPMFLFAGAFFPIDQLPAALQAIARITPLWHGVELCRGSVLGTLGLVDAVVHVAALGAYIVVGWVAARWAFQRRLSA
jgi:lipooligosaccharide transport system permease protein